MPHQKRKTRRQMEEEAGVMEMDHYDANRKEAQAAAAVRVIQTQTGSRRRVAAREARDDEIEAEDDRRQWVPRSAPTGATSTTSQKAATPGQRTPMRRLPSRTPSGVEAVSRQSRLQGPKH